MSANATTKETTKNPFGETPHPQPVLTLTELACLAGTSLQTIEQLLEWNLIVPRIQEPELGFGVDMLPRVRTMLRLHTGLGVDFPSMPLVLDLLDRIAELEKRLADLESNASP